MKVKSKDILENALDDYFPWFIGLYGYPDAHRIPDMLNMDVYDEFYDDYRSEDEWYTDILFQFDMSEDAYKEYKFWLWVESTAKIGDIYELQAA